MQTVTNADPRMWARVAASDPGLGLSPLAPELFALFTVPAPVINERGDHAVTILWAKEHAAYPSIRAAVAGDPVKGAIATAAFLQAITGRNAQPAQAVQTAAQNIARYEDALHALTDRMDGTLTQAVPVDDRLRLAQMLATSPDFRKVVELAGRFKRIVRDIRRSVVPDGRENIHNITEGRRIGDLTGSGRSLLALEPTRALFAAGYAKAKLPIYQRKGREQAGRGPIVFVADCSISMWDSIEGYSSGSWQGYLLRNNLPLDTPFYSRLTWARATMIAFAMVAREEHRDMAVVMFASPSGDDPGFASVELSGARMTLGQILAAASLEPRGGGTCYVPAMREAMRFFRQRKYQNADVVFATDGQPGDNPLLAEEPKEYYPTGRDPFPNEKARIQEVEASIVFPDWKQCMDDGMRVWSIFIGNIAPERKPDYHTQQYWDTERQEYVSQAEFYTRYPAQHPLYTLRTMSTEVIDLASINEQGALNIAASL